MSEDKDRENKDGGEKTQNTFHVFLTRQTFVVWYILLWSSRERQTVTGVRVVGPSRLFLSIRPQSQKYFFVLFLNEPLTSSRRL